MNPRQAHDRRMPCSLAVRMYCNGAVGLACVLLVIGLGFLKWDYPSFLGFLLAGIGIVFIAWGLLHGHRQISVLRAGCLAIATIEQQQVETDAETGTCYVITFCFYVPDGRELSLYGRKFQRTLTADQPPSEPVSVLYHPRAPRHAMILPDELPRGAEIQDDEVTDMAPGRTRWYLLLPLLLLVEVALLILL